MQCACLRRGIHCSIHAANKEKCNQAGCTNLMKVRGLCHRHDVESRILNSSHDDDQSEQQQDGDDIAASAK